MAAESMFGPIKLVRSFDPRMTGKTPSGPGRFIVVDDEPDPDFGEMMTDDELANCTPMPVYAEFVIYDGDESEPMLLLPPRRAYVRRG